VLRNDKTNGFTLLTVSILLTLFGCGSPQSSRYDPLGQLVWPKPPEAARIRFLAAYGEPADVGVRSGILDLILGEREPERLTAPVDVATLTGTAFVVVDLDAALVRIDPNEREFTVQRNSVDGPFHAPVSIAAGLNDSLYVVDAARQCVMVHTSDLTPVRALIRNLARPAGIAYSEPTNTLFLIDAGLGQILHLALDGTVLDTLGDAGDDENELNTPTHLTLADGHVLITDSYHFRVVKMTLTGEFISSMGYPGQVPGSFARPKGVAVDGLGNQYVVDALFDNVQIFNPAGQLLLFFGESGTGAAGTFNLPNGIHIDEQNMIYVADTYHGRVQVFQTVAPHDSTDSLTEEVIQ
jgi:sugar lactone lactonase YvrE